VRQVGHLPEVNRFVPYNKWRVLTASVPGHTGSKWLRR